MLDARSKSFEFDLITESPDGAVPCDRHLASVLRESLMIAWPELGISVDDVTRQGEGEGVTKFNQPFHKLMEA